LSTDTFSNLNVFNSLLITASFQFSKIFVIVSLLKFHDTFITLDDTLASSYKFENVIKLLFDIVLTFQVEVSTFLSSSLFLAK
jgi:hypothetical protein